MIGFRVGPVLLRNGENVQGEPARQGHHELVHLNEVRKWSRRNEGVGKQEQQGVARVVLIVIGRGVGTAGPHGTGREGLRPVLTPH